MLRAPTFLALLVVVFFIGRATVHPEKPPAPKCSEPSNTVWATSVLGYSTQYGEESWAATQALGMPNVYPQHGDIVKAWASLDPDAHAEWLELGYSQPVRVSGVEIYETYNPGAVASVELITTSGRRIHLQPADVAHGATANKLVIHTRCTDEPIAAVRVDVASHLVEGWNEIDAVGLVPCTER